VRCKILTIFEKMRRQSIAVLTAGIVLLGVFAPLVRAGITWSGDVDPANPATWTIDTYGYIGKNAYGTVKVNAGSDLLSGYVSLAYNSGSTGKVTVDGPGSTWTNSGGVITEIIDSNDAVDFQDFAALASEWLEVDCGEPDWCGRADIDYSGDVGFSDLQILTENWLEGI